MRAVPAGIAAKAAAGVVTLARCWRVTRRDGASFGFTDHDRDLISGGVTYAAATGIDASAMQAPLGLNVANHEIMGALSSAAITETAIAAGVWDDAAMEVRLVDWQTLEALLVFSGTIGQIRRGSAGFIAEIDGLARAALIPKQRTYSRRCDATFGDSRCGIDTDGAAYSATGTVTEALNDRLIKASGLSAFPSAAFDFGKLDWSSGPNISALSAVRAHTLDGSDAYIELWEETANTIAIGHTFRAEVGCGKTGKECRAFGNFANFRGFETMPGDAAVADYVRKGDDTFDGSSRYSFE